MMTNTLAELLSLKGKTALVTGGAGYLGSEIVHALAEQGADVIIASRDLDKCQARVEEVTSAWPDVSAHALSIDLTDRASITACIEDATAINGSIDILVMCAWSGRKNTFETISDEDWDYDIEVSLNGVFRTIKTAFDPLKKSRGVILLIGSMYGTVAPDWRMYDDVPQANPPSYGAAKAGVVQLTKYLGSFLAPYGIRTNCISPGPFPFPEVATEFPDFIDRLNNKNPLGRTGQPHEIKGAAALLCSPASSYITGQNLCIDGGWTIW